MAFQCLVAIAPVLPFGTQRHRIGLAIIAMAPLRPTRAGVKGVGGLPFDVLCVIKCKKYKDTAPA